MRRGSTAVLAMLLAGALAGPAGGDVQASPAAARGTASASVAGGATTTVATTVARRTCRVRLTLVADGRVRVRQAMAPGPARRWRVVLPLAAGHHRVVVIARAAARRCAASVGPVAATQRDTGAGAAPGSAAKRSPDGPGPAAGQLADAPAGTATAAASAAAGASSAPTDANPLARRPFRVDPGTQSAAAAAALRLQGDAADADAVQGIADTPTAKWFGDWNGSDPTSAVKQYVDAATAAGQLPLLVAYDIPGRDCGQYSAGGAGSAAAYRAWIDGMAAGIAGRPAAVIVEPDALAGLDCRDAAGQQQTLDLLAGAVQRLAIGQTTVYLDAGHDGWQPASVMASRLLAAGVRHARGFALNVANFRTTASELTYGRAIAALVPGAHFVIDTSRNGAGPAPDGAWCNPPGRRLGQRPMAFDAGSDVDALLWVKHPGESDGTCEGGPSAGRFWTEYAVSLTVGS